MIPCAPKHSKRYYNRHLKIFGSQIEPEGSLKIQETILLFLAKTLRNGKVRAAMDHGEKLRSRPAASFSGIMN